MIKQKLLRVFLSNRRTRGEGGRQGGNGCRSQDIPVPRDANRDRNTNVVSASTCLFRSAATSVSEFLTWLRLRNETSRTRDEIVRISAAENLIYFLGGTEIEDFSAFARNSRALRVYGSFRRCFGNSTRFLFDLELYTG